MINNLLPQNKGRAMDVISPAAVALIKTFEGDPPPRHPEWPCGASGITVGYGCDIGADPDSLGAWASYLSAGDFARLITAKGVTGNDASDLLPSVCDIAIDPIASERVLIDYSLPRTLAETLEAFPGADKLPPDSLGALVSLVYNRGSSVKGTRRQEMRWIKDAIAAGQVQWPQIAVEIAAMTYLWPEAPTASNLPGRRLREAALFVGGIDPAALRYGSTGARVADVQRALAAKGFDLVPDGQFGVCTMLALWRWQGAQAYSATGIADDVMLRLLGVGRT